MKINKRTLVNLELWARNGSQQPSANIPSLAKRHAENEVNGELPEDTFEASVGVDKGGPSKILVV